MAELTFVEKINAGIYPSKEAVYQVYIIQNLSQKGAADFFGLTSKIIRKLISFYGFQKDLAKIEEGKKAYFLEKYGVDNPAKMEQFKHKGPLKPEVLEKQKQTLIERYGTDKIASLDFVKEKRRQTCLERYGVSSVLKLPDVQNKARIASKTPEVLQKIKETNLKKYGCEYPTQSQAVQEKTKQTNLVRRGCAFPMQDKEVMQKAVNTNLAKRGVPYVMNDPAIVEKVKQTNIERYNVAWTCMLANHRIGHGVDSKPNLSFKEKLEAKGIKFERETCIKEYAFDFQVDNTVIEINPTISHNTVWTPFGKDHISRIDKKYHLNKTSVALEQGYRCIHIWDWDNIDAVVELLLPRKKIYARQCIIKEVDKKEAEQFISKYHCQGYANDKIRIGLYYNDVLVSIMTFKEPRYNKKYQYELIRYCSCYNVVGGAEKLFNYFIKEYNCHSLISYCDLSKFSGETYLKLGFKLFKKNAPSKHWYNPNTKQHFTDNLIRSAGVSRILHKCEPEQDQFAYTDDNDALMLQDGFLPVYDCGQATYIYNQPESMINQSNNDKQNN